jgi:hypothetical protein
MDLTIDYRELNMTLRKLLFSKRKMRSELLKLQKLHHEVHVELEKLASEEQTTQKQLEVSF